MSQRWALQLQRDVQAEADAAHLELVGRFARQVLEIQPTIEALRQLRVVHSCGTNSAVPIFDDLIIATPQSKGSRFMEAARQLGADVAA